MSIRKKACFVIIGAFSVLLCSFLPLNVSAIDATFNLNEYEKQAFDVSQNYYDYKIYKANGTLDHQCLATFNCYVGNNQQIRVASTHDSFPLKTDDIIVYNLALYSPAHLHHIDNLQFRALTPGYGVSTLYFHEVSDFSAIGGFTESFPTGSTSGVIDTQGYFISNLYEIALVVTVDGNRQLGSFNQNTVDIAVNMGNTSTSDVLIVAVTGFTVYRHVGSDSKRAIDNQTQQQQNQYDAEKQEESQRENQASGDSSTAQGLFNFNVLNPFANLWGAFNSSGCVSIPIIAGMLHSSNTTYCPWFPSSVRSVVTPVMAIASSMLLFGFVVRWLSGNSGDIYGARNMNKELNG